jgi:excisionase family DNA binding protein
MSGTTLTKSDLLTPDEVADVLRIQRSTVLDRLRRGALPGRKFGKSWLILRSQLEEHIAEEFEVGG